MAVFKWTLELLADANGFSSLYWFPAVWNESDESHRSHACVFQDHSCSGKDGCWRTHLIECWNVWSTKHTVHVHAYLMPWCFLHHCYVWTDLLFEFSDLALWCFMETFCYLVLISPPCVLWGVPVSLRVRSLITVFMSLLSPAWLPYKNTALLPSQKDSSCPITSRFIRRTLGVLKLCERWSCCLCLSGVWAVISHVERWVLLM